MQQELETHAEHALTQLARDFDQWRQHRRTRFERIPPLLWEQAIALSQQIPIAQIAKRLRLRGSDLKKRCTAPPATVAELDPAPSTPLGFVDVTPPSPWPRPTAATEVDLQRADGARLRIHCREPQFPLATLVRTFLETR
jgi:hypothetical protein